MEKFGGDGMRVESVMRTGKVCEKCQAKQGLKALSAKPVDFRHYALSPQHVSQACSKHSQMNVFTRSFLVAIVRDQIFFNQHGRK